jgi:hypothetical protein
MKPVVSLSLAIPLAVSLVACYGSAPGRPPKVPLPTISTDAELVVHSETRTSIENVAKEASSCPAGHNAPDPACTITRYTVAEPVTRTKTTATLGEQALDFAQFKVITDPKWNDKLAELDDLSHKCTRANVPRYAGIGLMVGGLVTGMIVGGSAGKGIAYGGFIGGGVSYGVGYFAYGGRDCVRAAALYRELDLSRDTGLTIVEGADTAVEMKTLAEQFNATRGGSHASSDAPPARASTRMRMRR